MCKNFSHLQSPVSFELYFVDEFFEEEIYSEDDLQQAIVIDNKETSFHITVSIEARGKGKLKLGNLHQRWSRKQFGKFVLGGNILHDSIRDEINYFFHPGDFKPPLAVYFAGYRPAEGFEGYFMMKNLGCPFLLFSDPRLEGGAFYLGSEELENKIKETIQYYLDYLGLTSKDLILSGLSMGTFPSLYYGAAFEPRAVIVGKPLANIGTIARRGRLEAPGVFNTGFDVLRHQTGGVSSQHMEDLDQTFWNAFKKASFTQTTFGLSYMKDEDMDSLNDEISDMEEDGCDVSVTSVLKKYDADGNLVSVTVGIRNETTGEKSYRTFNA